jgi:hypothetical protein
MKSSSIELKRPLLINKSHNIANIYEWLTYFYYFFVSHKIRCGQNISLLSFNIRKTKLANHEFIVFIMILKCVRLPTYTTSAATLTEIIASEWSCPQTPLSERCIESAFKKRICRALLNCLLCECQCEWLCNVNVSITLHFVQQEVLQQENYWRRGEQHMKPLHFSLSFSHSFFSLKSERARERIFSLLFLPLFICLCSQFHS